jgi:Cu(I)/Ag(I) efflux system membrane fusion protein/cobalt-zinc-cadmium efflux system membrane fusion protein
LTLDEARPWHKPVSSRAWLKLIAAVVSIAIGAVGAAVFLDDSSRPATQAQAQRYHCPMHPTYTSDKPGDCPICGMKLVPMEDPGAGAATAEPGERKVAFYRSPMDPTIRSDKPAKDSMGMDFVPVYEDEGDAPPSSVAGRAVVTISSERRQVLGVRSEEVRKMPLAHRIRTVGKVAVDERLLRQVRTKVEGYIEHLYVDYTGQFVKRGERLLSIFSPDLVATQQEYLLALRGRNRLSESAVPSAAEGSSSLLEAARQRLLLWDIRPADIEKLERTGQVTRTLNVYSEIKPKRFADVFLNVDMGVGTRSGPTAPSSRRRPAAGRFSRPRGEGRFEPRGGRGKIEGSGVQIVSGLAEATAVVRTPIDSESV